MVVALRRDRLTVEEIEEIAMPLLSGILGDFGFDGIATTEDHDYDGDPIIRMTAKVQRLVPVKIIADSLDRVRTELLRTGEERFVIFHTERPEPNDPEATGVDSDEKW